MQNKWKFFPRLSSIILVVGFVVTVLLNLQAAPLTTHAAFLPPPPSNGPDTTNPVLLIHGFHFAGFPSDLISKGSTDGFDCESTWGNAKNYLKRNFTYNSTQFTWNPKSLITIGYYKGDTSCNDTLSNYKDYCKNTYDSVFKSSFFVDTTHTYLTSSSNGTNDQSIPQLGCELAWMIYKNYASHGKYVQVVGHSMGGLITRWALYATQQHLLHQQYSSSGNFSFQDFPPGPLLVTDVVTFDTPHGGIPGLASEGLCNSCIQAREMEEWSVFMNAIVGAQGHDLHTSGSPNWTLMGMSSPCSKDLVDSGTSMYMEGVRKFLFLSPCLDHGDFMKDVDTSRFVNKQVYIVRGKRYVNTSDCSNKLHSSTLPQPDVLDGYPNDALFLRGDNTPKDSQPSSWGCFKNGPHALKIMMLALIHQDW